MNTGSYIRLSAWFRPRCWLAAALEFLLYKARDLHLLLRAVQLILTHILPYFSHLCCSVYSQDQGMARRFTGQAQSVMCFLDLPSSYHLIASENARSSCVLSTIKDWDLLHRGPFCVVFCKIVNLCHFPVT